MHPSRVILELVACTRLRTRTKWQTKPAIDIKPSKRYLWAKAYNREGKMTRLIMALVFVTCATAAHSHGGGCRKSSPPGQCCHMDNSTGSVHCH